MNATDELKSVRDDILQCRQCHLYKGRTYPVIGDGNHNADVMFIGDIPGDDEDAQALPCVGAPGHILDKLLASINLQRKDVYVCNIIKCKSMTDKKDVTNDQIKECNQYLTRQIEAIKPKVLVTMGNNAIRTVAPMFGIIEAAWMISKIHGSILIPDPLFSASSIKTGEPEMANIKIMPMYHPSALTHNPPLSETMRADFKLLKTTLETS